MKRCGNLAGGGCISRPTDSLRLHPHWPITTRTKSSAIPGEVARVQALTGAPRRYTESLHDGRKSSVAVTKKLMPAGKAIKGAAIRTFAGVKRSA